MAELLTKTLLYGKGALVMVNNDWDSAIWPQPGEPLLLLDVLRDVDALPGVVLAVCLFELFQYNRGLPAVWCSPRE